MQHQQHLYCSVTRHVPTVNIFIQIISACSCTAATSSCLVSCSSAPSKLQWCCVESGHWPEWQLSCWECMSQSLFLQQPSQHHPLQQDQLHCTMSKPAAGDVGGCRVMQGLVDSLPSFRHEQLQHENFEGHRGTITVVVVKKLLPRRSCCFAHDPCSNES